MNVIGTFADILAIEPQHRDLLCGMRDIVLADNENVVEVCRPGEKSVSWGLGPKKNSEAYVYALPYKNHVNLGFFQGASLPNPDGILKGSGKAMRHTSLTDPTHLKNPAISALIAHARQERRAALNQ